jgi:hypothetical protein
MDYNDDGKDPRILCEFKEPMRGEIIDSIVFNDD